VDAFDAGRAVLTGEAAHHLGRVLRAERGQLYELSDGSAVWLGKVESSAKERVEFRLLEPVPC
jgi:16S rRNA U1498 N3-methylase RsmE